MGATIWCLSPSTKDAGDDYDHSLFIQEIDALDVIASDLNVASLSAFIDYSDAEMDFLDEDVEHDEIWFPAADVLTSFDAVVQRLDSGPHEALDENLREALLEELRDCQLKVRKAKDIGEGVRFSFVM